MPSFLYFIPKARPSDINQEGLSRWGLSYLVDDLAGVQKAEGTRLHSRACSGIDGVEGVVVGSSANWSAEEVKLTDQIEWKKFPKSFIQGEGIDAENEKLRPSLGVIKGQPLPGPQDLARADQLSGKSLTLADANKWLIPNARVITDTGHAVCGLRCSFDLDDETGDWVRGQVLPQYRKIWDHANAYVNNRLEAMLKATDGEPVTWEIPDWQAMVVDAIQVNYRVSARELATLGVLVTGLAQEIAKILIDDEGYDRIKKKEAGGTGAG